MLIAVIPVKDYLTAKHQIHLACHQADGIELRLDYLSLFNFNEIAALRHESSLFNLPVIFTLRKKSQGGFYKNNQQKHLQAILALCELKPDYFDLEYNISKKCLKKITRSYPDIKLICSYHNFNETPPDLISIFQSMQQPFFYGYKIAVKANNTLDALFIFQFVRSLHKKYILTGIGMGKEGQSTRILSPIMGNAMTYACLDPTQSTADGQLTLHELLTHYHFRKLNTASKIYALLGDPIDLSLGHVLHNQAIRILEKNAVYIKLRATQDNIGEIIAECRKLPFYGFSITMPLKEAILCLLDKIDGYSQPIKAINSIIKYKKKFIGFNTDGLGAMRALSEKIADIAKQKIIILGAGGAARAIAYEALQQKANVIILNRTLDKAKKLAAALGCEGYSLTSMKQLKKIGYTLMINTLPNSAYTQKSLKKLLDSKLFDSSTLLSTPFAMDIVYQPMDTEFLKIAQEANCICIFGYEMYIHQALMQITRWFNPKEKKLNRIKNAWLTLFAIRC